MPKLTPETKEARVRVREKFGERLRTAMAAAGLTQAELASISGIPQSNLSVMMSGRLGASLERLLALSRALKVEPQDLMPLGETEGLAPSEPHSDGTPRRRHPVERGIAHRLGVDGKQPAQSWIQWATSDKTVVMEEGLSEYIVKHQGQLTVEVANALVAYRPVQIHGGMVVKDEAYWDRQREHIEREIAANQEAMQAREKTRAGTAVSEPEDRAGPGRDQVRSRKAHSRA